MDEWWYGTAGNGHQVGELGELLITSESQVDMVWHEGELLLLQADTSAEFEDLGSEILQDTGHEDTSILANSLGVCTVFQESVHSSCWEHKPSSGGS